jgi:hypothetical protein
MKAKALTVNKTLRFLHLDDTSDPVHTKARLGSQSFEAFSAMLRVNTSLDLVLPPFETDGADEMLVDSRNKLHIEQRLNQVGRGRLLSSCQTTREQWVDTLCELDSGNVDNSPPFRVSCLFRVLRSNPTVVYMS